MGGPEAPVPVHAEAVPGRPARVRWVVPSGLLGFVGEPAVLPAALGELRARGVLARVAVVPAAVEIDLVEPHTWAELGDDVRRALQAALADPAGWHPPADDADPIRTRLAAAARAVLAGEVGDYARSHGGSLELVDVHDGVVEVALHGTCDGCPAAGRTLEDRVLVAVRALDPSVREVRSRRADPAPTAPGAGGRRTLPLAVRRR